MGAYPSRTCLPSIPGSPEGSGTRVSPEKRKWGAKDVYRYSRGWLVPYMRSRVLPGEFHPITAYLFIEYKCNLDCWYCWSYDNKVKGMTEDVARRSIDWLHDNGCRVLALMGGEPLLRPDFVHKVVCYAAKKGFRDLSHRHEWTLASARRGGSSWRRGRVSLQFCHGFLGPEAKPPQSVGSSTEESGAHFAQAICGRLLGLLQHEYLS